jgi:putative endonuclease
MGHKAYILYSQRANLHYVGNTALPIEKRLAQHNAGVHKKAATKRGIPWSVLMIIPCESRLQARRIEAHIKKMKSKVYINNLSKYPEMCQKLLLRFASPQEEE